MATGTSLFSPSVTAGQSQKTKGGGSNRVFSSNRPLQDLRTTARKTSGVPSPNLFNPSAVRSQAASSALSQIGDTLTSYISTMSLREKHLRDNSYLSATPLAQNKFDLNLKRELRKYYRSDGEDVSPPSDYSADLGFGISFNGGALLDDAGNRRTFTEAVTFFHDQFTELRKKKAPSVKAEGKVSLTLQQGQFTSLVDAQGYSTKRQGLKLANNMNTVVRGYKDVVAADRGFNAETFGTHMKALEDLTVASTSVVDPGAAFQAFQEASGDLLAVGITDAALNRDNEMAIKLLALSPLRDTRELRKVMSGLNWKDINYLSTEREKYRGGSPTYRYGEPPPKNIINYFGWAYAQQSPKRQSELQKRAVDAFSSQVKQVRVELDTRIEGIIASATSPMIKDSAFRQNIRVSADKAMKDVARVYPQHLFPVEHKEAVASILVGSEAVNIRNMFNTVPTDQLGAMVMSESARVSKEIASKIPNTNFAVSTLPLQNKTQQILLKFADNEEKIRRLDPYGSLKRISKDVRELDSRLTKGLYTNIGEKFRDQEVLRRRVLEKAGKLGVRPSFISGNDADVLQGLAKRGNTPELLQVVSQIRDKYGESIFFDYIVPDIGETAGLGKHVGAVAMIPDKAVFGAAMDAKINSRENAKLLKDLKIETKTFEAAMNEGYYWPTDFFDRYKYGSYPLERLDARIDDIAGDPATRSNLKTSMRSLVRDMVYQKLVNGDISEDYTGLSYYRGGAGKSALHETIDTLVNGLGRPVTFLGKETVAPNHFSLNEPRIEVLEEVLFHPQFVRDRIIPYVRPNRAMAIKAERDGISNPSEVFERFFLDEGVVSWHMSHDGLVPAIENPLFPGNVTSFETFDGSPFIIPYSVVDTLVVNEAYK